MKDCPVIVGIIGAMDVEVTLLQEHMDNRETVFVAGAPYCQGIIAGVPCVVVRCGVGKVNAALCTQVLVDHFEVTHIINTGAAGSLDATLDIGDVVVALDCVQHDMDATKLGYAPGQVPGLPSAIFPVDGELSDAVAAAARAAVPEISIQRGRIATGDRFICSDDDKHYIAHAFGACCCEMEGAAIAQACHANGIPFSIIRAISDKADGSDAEAYPVFEEKAAHRSALIVERFLADMPLHDSLGEYL
ncbi:5'-methylthioadenosine/adenosylhomocysteine nucleosidase [Cryptobacterium curtum]